MLCKSSASTSPVQHLLVSAIGFTDTISFPAIIGRANILTNVPPVKLAGVITANMHEVN